MHSGPSRSIVIGFTLLASLVLRAPDAGAQQMPAIEFAFPNQLVRGQSTVVHVAIPSREMFAGAEVTPSAGVTVTGVTNSKRAELSQNVAWWDVTLEVARDAAPGRRTIALLTPTLRSTPTPITIPSHAPAISDLRVAAAAAGPTAVDVQFGAADDSADLGEAPYVWFTIACGGEPTVGVVRGKRSGGVVRASIPRPATGACDLELRASDTQRIDSNTLKTRVP
jgi:hypothetical protein